MRIILCISFLWLSLGGFSQFEDGENTSIAALDESHLSSKDYPYIDKFHEAIREKINGNYEEAKNLFEACLEIRQDDDAVYFGLAEIEKQEKMYSKALEYYTKAFNLDPDNFIYLQELAYMTYKKGDFEEAEPLFEKMCQRKPRNPDYRYGFIKILIYNKEYKSAIEQINHLQDQVGIIPELMGMKADLYLELKSTKKAEETILALKNEYPDNLEVLRKVIGFYEEQDDKNKALRLLEELVKKDPENGHAYFILANNYLEQDEVDNFLKIAPRVFQFKNVSVENKILVFNQLKNHLSPQDSLIIAGAEKIAEDYPENAEAQVNYANELITQKKTKQALAIFRKIVESNPDDFNTWGEVLAFENRHRDYEALYEDGKKAINYFPSMPYTYFSAARGALHTGRLDEANAFLEAGKMYLLDSKIHEAQFHSIWGQIYFQQNEYKKGIIQFEKAISIDNVASIRVSYAWALAKANIAQDVAKELLSDIGMERRSAKYYIVKALIFENEKSLKKGIKTLVEGSKNIYHNAEIFDLLGDLYFQNENIEGAVEAWKRALAGESRNKVIPKKIKEEQYYAPKYY